MRPKTPILLQPLSALPLSLLKPRTLPEFSAIFFLTTPILSGKLYPQHRHLVQAIGLIPAQKPNLTHKIEQFTVVKHTIGLPKVFLDNFDLWQVTSDGFSFTW
jgi:hypothetical protein